MDGWQKDKRYKDVLESRETTQKRKRILWDYLGDNVTVSLLDSLSLLMNNLAFSDLISDEGLDAEID